MTLAIREMEIRAEALEEGLTKGRAEGLTKGRAEGRAEGLTKGREEGLTKGLEKERVFGIRRLMEKLHLSEEEAMEFMDIPKSEQPRYAMLLRQQ